MWVQDKVANKEIVIMKVPTEDNLADAVTKAVDAQVITKHVLGIHAQILCDRHPLTPKIDTNDEEIGIGGHVGSGDQEIVGEGDEGIRIEE